MRHRTIHTIDLDPEEIDDLEAVRQRAVDDGGYLHIEIRHAHTGPERVAVVTNATEADLDTIQSYLPSNYRAKVELRVGWEGYNEERELIFIRGHDYAGWTLDGYVIPRLGSGLWWAEEVFE